jgi:small subunit ribosomal protein S5
MSEDVSNQNQNQSPAPDAPAPVPPAAAVGEAPAPAPEPESGGYGRDQRGGGGGRGRGRGRGGPDSGRRPTPEVGELDENVVKVYRCATVVKGGRRFSFAALVVVGDRNGRVGIGYGKANEVPSAVEKAGKAARRNMVKINLAGTTLPHQVAARYGASKVTMIPAGPGTGVIAGASVRSVMELAGVKDVLTKCYGSTSPKNLVRAAFDGLKELRSKDDVAKLREVALA